MIEYIVENKKYSLSYKELREEYNRHNNMSADEFLNNLPSALHLACMICYLKEIPTDICLSDSGIIHELVHLISIPFEQVLELGKIRNLFKEQLELA